MADIKDKILVEEQAAKISLEQTGSSFVGFIHSFPRGKKILLLVLAILIIPAIVGARIGSRLITEHGLQSALITAHPAYVAALDPLVDPVTILNSGHGWYSAYTQIKNRNLDLTATNIPYEFNFLNAAGQSVARVAGTTYLLADQKKYLIVPRVETTQQIVSAQVTLDSTAVQWQKRLGVPDVALRTDTPFISNDQNPVTLVAEGAVVNNSPYNLGTVHLVFLLYDKNNKIVAVSQRDEFTIPAFGRRAYRQTWPDLLATDIARAQVIADTNTLDNDNVASGSGSAPVSQPPQSGQ